MGSGRRCIETGVIAALFAVLAGAAGQAGSIAPTAPAPLGRLVDVGGGRRVHLYCTGVGGPAVIVVGGGFSFDWGLIQPQVARFTRVCTYDPSGSVWSDPVPGGGPPKCSERVEELHALLNSARIQGPYLLVGYSIGGLYARLYARLYPGEVAGMVIVDHAFLGTDNAPKPAEMSLKPDTPPVLISQTPITLDLEDDLNFAKLPQRNQQLHRWALSLPIQHPTPEMAAECGVEVENLSGAQAHPLRHLPLIVLSTRYESASYDKLQKHLLSLSWNSSQIVAENSSHMVIIDEPEIVVGAIRRMVQTLRQ